MNLLCYQRALLEESLKQNEERQGDGSVSVEGGVDDEVEEFRIEAVQMYINSTFQLLAKYDTE